MAQDFEAHSELRDMLGDGGVKKNVLGDVAPSAKVWSLVPLIAIRG
jgi:hypothetical protein